MEASSASDLAFEWVEHTRKSLFLTGEAGTGKTTFLKKIVRETHKKTVVVAPTGVAAINAGGSTIHSMFGLPTRMFVPTYDPVDPNEAQNIPMMQGHFHYSKAKLELLQNLELLIIDEISMVRCDLLDAIDLALKSARRTQLPFGGVQLLMIGDLFQLPPVVRQQEGVLLNQHYPSPYFFSAKSYAELGAAVMELTEIHRQRDRSFIQLLNNVRHAQLDYDDFEFLNSKLQPDFEPDSDGWITLCSHNASAQSINQRKLEELESHLYRHRADIKGNFVESQYPTDVELELKVGAQVMFIKNDSSGEGRYYNGKLGIVHRFETEKIAVRFPENGRIIEVEREKWQNLKYEYDASNDSVNQSELGSFEQFPLRLAWAITIHKSQGLTLEKVVIDAGRSFAPGQVYVALSRCTSFDGIVLKTAIQGRNLMVDERCLAFLENKSKSASMIRDIQRAKQEYALERLKKHYDTIGLRDHLASLLQKAHKPGRSTAKKPGKTYPVEWTQHLQKGIIHLNDWQDVSRKFHHRLQRIYNEQQDQSQAIQEALSVECTKASEWFAHQIIENLMTPLGKLIQIWSVKSKSKTLWKEAESLQEIYWAKVLQLQAVNYLGHNLYTGAQWEKPQHSPTLSDQELAVQEAVGDSIFATYLQFKEHRDLAHVAVERDLSLSTVESHLARLIFEDLVSVQELMPASDIEHLESVIKEAKSHSVSHLKTLVDRRFSYGQLQWIKAHLKIK
jgi:ATP-dependent DNA helicase PIF1